MTECRYCGDAHDERDLCRARRVSRRRFLFVGVAAVAAAATAPLVPKGFTIERTIHHGTSVWPECTGILAGESDAVYRSYLAFDRALREVCMPRIISDLNEPRPIEKWLAERV